MQLVDLLSKDESLRLECLRLAIAAGQPDLRGSFLKFVRNEETGVRQRADAAPGKPNAI